MSELKTYSIKNVSKQTLCFNGAPVSPMMSVTQITAEIWEHYKVIPMWVRLIESGDVIVSEQVMNVADIDPEALGEASVSPAPVVPAQSRVGDDRVKLTIGVEGEAERDISKTEAASVDWDLVQGMTKPQIEDYADQFMVQLSLDDTKTEMIEAFKQAVA